MRVKQFNSVVQLKNNIIPEILYKLHCSCNWVRGRAPQFYNHCCNIHKMDKKKHNFSWLSSGMSLRYLRTFRGTYCFHYQDGNRPNDRLHGYNIPQDVFSFIHVPSHTRWVQYQQYLCLEMKAFARLAVLPTLTAKTQWAWVCVLEVNPGRATFKFCLIRWHWHPVCTHWWGKWACYLSLKRFLLQHIFRTVLNLTHTLDIIILVSKE